MQSDSEFFSKTYHTSQYLCPYPFSLFFSNCLDLDQLCKVSIRLIYSFSTSATVMHTIYLFLISFCVTYVFSFRSCALYGFSSSDQYFLSSCQFVEFQAILCFFFIGFVLSFFMICIASLPNIS